MNEDWNNPLVPVIYALFGSNRTFTNCPSELDPCQVKPPLNFYPAKREIKTCFMRLTHRVVGNKEYIYLCLGSVNRLASHLAYVFFCSCHDNELQPHLINDPNDWLIHIVNSINSGADLWERKERIFPSLIFCDNVRKQLHALNEGDPLLKQFVNKLFELEVYCKNWIDGPFDPNLLPFKVTTESTATLEAYGDDRKFRCPDGEDRIFSWHARLTPHARRLHFFPSADTRQIIIGYIGPHLGTVNDPR